MPFANLFRRNPRRRRTTDRLETVSDLIGPGCLIAGALSGRGNYLVEGEVIGNGAFDGVVVLAAGGYWQGELVADYVRVAGKVEGNVGARVKLELEATAVVTGNLASPLIAIAEGAVYEGTISRPRDTRVTRHPERRGNGGSAASG